VTLFIKNFNKTAIVWKDEQISYETVLSKTEYFKSLYSIAKGSRISIFSENRPEWVYSLYSSWASNCALVPIDYLSTAEEAAYILNDCKPDVVFISNQTSKVFEKALKLSNYDFTIINIDEIDSTAETLFSGFPEFDLQDTSLIIYTSGTTGTPKGVMLSFENILVNLDGVINDNKIYTKDDCVMVMLPLHHIFPLLGSLAAPLFIGGHIAFCPSLSSEDIINTLQKNKVAIIIGVPRFYKLIQKGIMDKINKKGIAKLLFKIAGKINSYQFSRKIFSQVHVRFGGNIKFLVSGGAALDKVVARDLQVLGFEVLEGFGMTEAAPMITFTRPGDVVIGSCGKALAANEVKIVDGEVTAKGKNIMKGYFNRVQETNDVIVDGWLHTGDLGYLDEEGHLFITGRKKEIIVFSNGKNINPEEVENKIASFSELANEVGVFMKDDKLNAVIYPDFEKALKENIANLEEYFRHKVIDVYNNAVSSFKRIAQFKLINEPLPRTRLSKLKRFTLPDLVRPTKKEEFITEEPAGEEYKIIRDFLVDQKSAAIKPTDHLENDLSLDSLDRVTLQVFLNSSFGINIQEEDFSKYPTVLQISEYVRDTKTKTEIDTVDWGEILHQTVNLNLPKSWFTHNLIKNSAKIFLKLYFRIKSEGNDKLPDGPFILAPNHQSFFDGLFVAVFLKNKLMRKTYFYAKEQHVRKGWVKFIADRHNVIVMDINKDLKQSLQKMAAVLQKGKNIIIFPEGTRTISGNLGNYKKTFAILSRELNVPVVPIAIKGAFEALPKGSIFPRPFKKINIKFLDPVYPKDHSTYESLRSKVYEKVFAILS